MPPTDTAAVTPDGPCAKRRKQIQLRCVAAMSSKSAPAKKPLILCVDDSENQLWLRAQVLERNGYSVLTASTAANALEFLRDNAISLVISDHMLGEITGLQLAGEIKRIKPHIPVVL